MRKRLLYAASAQWAAVALEADLLVESPAFRALKSEGRTLAGFLRRPDGATVFLRRSRARSFAAGLADRLRGSRAARALRGGALLAGAGLRCPRPLAAMEALSAGSIRESYLLTEALENAERFSVYALGPSLERRHGYRRRKTVCDAVAAEVRRLHDAGLHTRDLQETNIMVGPRGGGLGIYFVDLEDFRRAGAVSWRRRMLNLVHLDRSIGRFLCRAARLAFLYAYLGGAPGRAARRALVRDYLRLRERVERRHRRRALGRAPGGRKGMDRR